MIIQSNELISSYNDLPMLKAYHSIREPFSRENTRHCHTAFEISIISKGHGIYSVEENEYPFEPNDVFLFSTNENHCITRCIDELVIINLQFEPRFVWMPGNDAFNLRYLDVFFRRNSSFRHILSHDDVCAGEIRHLLFQIDQEFLKKDDFYDLMVKNLLLTTLVEIRRNYSSWFDKGTSEHSSIEQMENMRRVMQYIDNHLPEELSIDMLSGEAHMCRSNFSAIFKQLNGVAPWEYIVSQRVNHGANLLRTTSMPITEVAMACGFNSTANFNYAFRKQTGKSPTQFRKEK